MFTMDMKIAGFDDELNDAMRKEIKRQEEHVGRIASKTMQVQEYLRLKDL